MRRYNSDYHHSTHSVLIKFFSGKEVVSDVSATLTSSKDKMTGALSRLGKHYEQRQLSLYLLDVFQCCDLTSQEDWLKVRDREEN